MRHGMSRNFGLRLRSQQRAAPCQTFVEGPLTLPMFSLETAPGLNCVHGRRFREANDFSIGHCLASHPEQAGWPLAVRYLLRRSGLAKLS